MQHQTMDVHTIIFMANLVIISLMKEAYLCRRENGDLNSPRDDIDQMMDNMAKSNEISFVSLSDVPIKDYFDVNNTDCNVDTMTISTTKSFTGHVKYEPINGEFQTLFSFYTNK
jgi:hypothetical protein